MYRPEDSKMISPKYEGQDIVNEGALGHQYQFNKLFDNDNIDVEHKI